MGIKKPKLKLEEAAFYEFDPYYDEILLFASIEVPTSQDYYEPVDEEKQLYKLIKKPNVYQFKQDVEARLLKKKKPWWPHSRALSMTVSIKGPQSHIKFKDLDNYLKTIFDAIKGIVIEDDHQVTKVTVDKEENQFRSGFTLSIRLNPIKGEPSVDCGSDPNSWEEKRKLKIDRGGMCCIDRY